MTAQGIEAASAGETQSGSTEGESPVGSPMRTTNTSGQSAQQGSGIKGSTPGDSKGMTATLEARTCAGREDGIPAGMKPWSGGDSAPDDWDRRTVQFRSGEVRHAQAGVVWKLGWQHHYGQGDIIAYTPKASTLDADKERIARIVDPHTFKLIEHYCTTGQNQWVAREEAEASVFAAYPGLRTDLHEAYAKADAILASPNASRGGPRETDDEFLERVGRGDHDGPGGSRQPNASNGVSALREALEWYGEQARLARLIHSEGDAGRHALAADGGKRAREVLA